MIGPEIEEGVYTFNYQHFADNAEYHGPVFKCKMSSKPDRMGERCPSNCSILSYKT